MPDLVLKGCSFSGDALPGTEVLLYCTSEGADLGGSVVLREIGLCVVVTSGNGLEAEEVTASCSWEVS